MALARTRRRAGEGELVFGSHQARGEGNQEPGGGVKRRIWAISGCAVALPSGAGRTKTPEAGGGAGKLRGPGVDHLWADTPGRRSSVGEDVFVVGHGVHVVAGFVGVWPRAVRRRSGRGSCQAPRWRRIFSTTRGSPTRAMTRIGSWQTGSGGGPHARRGGSAFAKATARQVRSRQCLEGSFRLRP